MALTPKHKQALKARAHQLKPIVLLGHQGLTKPVEKEINQALEDHELIKIRLAGQDREARQQIASQVCTDLQAELVQLIGAIAILYRKSNKNS